MTVSRAVLPVVFAVSLSAAANDAAPRQKHRFVVELDPDAGATGGASDGVRAIERFDTADKSYVVVEADSAEALAKHLQRAGVPARKATEVKDVNSPTRGGGKPAADRPRDGQKTFVIERSIPGVGTFPDARKEAISKKSNAAIAQIGDSIEWVHSYLTDEGTYCVYRATDEGTIRKHGAIAGAPITKISEARVVPP
jgi:hypothetical protein